jgi:anaerobic ribonucleoside-triphosphate reductase activating protein
MNYGNIKKCDIADGSGVRVSLFISGCSNHCKGCFNPETWDFNYGNSFIEDTKKEIFDQLDLHYVNGLTLLGGDPFESANQKVLTPFLKEVRDKYPNKSIWAYTGYIYENLISKDIYPRCECTDEMLSYIDILVDGPFMEEKKNISLVFRGSENQRIIDLNETRKTGKLSLWKNS